MTRGQVKRRLSFNWWQYLALALLPLFVINLSMSMDMPMDHGDSHHPKAPDEHHALWSKCGYCDLLYSCPALPGGTSTFTLGTPPPANALTPATRLGHARQSIFPGARSRAPPIIA